MRLSVTGHRARAGLDWGWVEREARAVLASCGAGLVGMSSLAAGADQLVARLILDGGGAHVAVLPMPDYERCFASGDALRRFRALRARSEVVVLPGGGSDEDAFLAAGHYIVEQADVLLAVWDGRPAVGKGGSGDVVAYARSLGRRVIHLDPMRRVRSGPGG